jgi:hypothetical protein
MVSFVPSALPAAFPLPTPPPQVFAFAILSSFELPMHFGTLKALPATEGIRESEL